MNVRVLEKYFSHFIHRTPLHHLLRLTANGECQEFLDLLCTLYSKRTIPHSYMHFMHPSKCRRLQRGVRATKERMVEGGCRRVGRSREGRVVWRRVHPKRGLEGNIVGGWMDRWSGCEGEMLCYQEATYKIIRQRRGHAHHPAHPPIGAECI